MTSSDPQQRLLGHLNAASLGYAIGCIGQSLFLRLSRPDHAFSRLQGQRPEIP
jgi:hypothetical protein